MPFPSTLRDKPPIHYKTQYLRDLSDRMSTLLLPNRGPPPGQRPRLMVDQRQQQPRTIIELSDDDSDSDIPMAELRGRHDAHVKREPLSAGSAWSLGSPGSAGLPGVSRAGSIQIHSDNSEPEMPSPAHKRPRIRRNIPDRFVRMLSPPYNPNQIAPQARPVDVQYPAVTRNDQDGRSTHNMTPSFGPNQKSPAKSVKQPPYYHDAKLECRMYRGAGYERFPVALGTIDGHQEACDEWDAIVAVDAQRETLGLPPTNTQAMDETVAIRDEEAVAILGDVLEILPDIEHDFALKKIREHLARLRNADVYLQEQAAAGDIVSDILEAESYPKEKEKTQPKAKSGAVADETGATIVWDKALVKDGSYLKDAVILLAGQFPHIPTHYIFRVVHEKRSVFESYKDIQQTDDKYYASNTKPYYRMRAPRTLLEKKYSARTHQERRDPSKFSQMVNELQAARQHVAREALKVEKQKEKDDAEAVNLAVHKESGDIVECKCCFDDEIPLNRAVSCQGDDIHFFCFNCVNQLADTQIGLMKYEMVCMHSDGCKATLSAEAIGQAIPMKTFDRLAFNQQQAEITAAGIDGLEQCPYCDFKGICGPVEEEKVFDCQNSDCFRATCRLCKDDAHVPKTCEEVKKDKGLSARHAVEEARTEAMVRACPKCKVKIIKELGCNKMICNQCHCIMCYVCKADITSGKQGGYEHFNRPGAKCALYDKAGDDVHEREANEAELEAIKDAKAKDADIDEKDLQIETGKDGKTKNKNKNAYQPAAAPNPYVARFLAPGFQFFDEAPLQNLLNNPAPQRRNLVVDDGNGFGAMHRGIRDLQQEQRNLEVQLQGVRDRQARAAAERQRVQDNMLADIQNQNARIQARLREQDELLIAGIRPPRRDRNETRNALVQAEERERRVREQLARLDAQNNQGLRQRAREEARRTQVAAQAAQAPAYPAYNAWPEFGNAWPAQPAPQLPQPGHIATAAPAWQLPQPHARRNRDLYPVYDPAVDYTNELPDIQYNVDADLNAPGNQNMVDFVWPGLENVLGEHNWDLPLIRQREAPEQDQQGQQQPRRR